MSDLRSQFLAGLQITGGIGWVGRRSSRRTFQYSFPGRRGILSISLHRDILSIEVVESKGCYTLEGSLPGYHIIKADSILKLML